MNARRHPSLPAIAGALLLASLSSPAEPTEKILLTGTGSDTEVEWEFLCNTGRRAGEWSTIPVPSQWDMQGFGTLEYGHLQPSHPDEKGHYRTRFPTPETAEGSRTFLVFGAAMTDTEVTLNGQSAGPTHHGGFTEFRYEITGLLKAPGEENLLEAIVAKESHHQSINRAERRADYWVFGGIFRPVWLEVVPATFIENVALDAKADGSFQAEVHLDGKQLAGSIVAMEIVDSEDQVVASANAKVSPAEDNKGRATFATTVKDIRTWTAETPHLYTARFRLESGDTALHDFSQRFGFRTIELREGEGVFVNGERIIFKGVNRHTFRPESGRTLSIAQNREDVELLKEMNANAVRMSHYPPDPVFLDFADELGLYVINELSGWQDAYSTEAGRPLVREMVTRDRNHPSIIFWSNGNEGGWNDELNDDFAKWDLQDRPLIRTFAGHQHGNTVFRGINTKHYQNYENFTKFLNGPDLVMPTEFLHGLYDGGHGAGLRDYWDAITKSPVGLGGFLWVLADEGTARANDQGEPYIDTAGNWAPDGIVGPHHEREGSFRTIRKIYAPVQIGDELPEGFKGTLAVSNRYHFTNLREVGFAWELVNFPSPESADTEREVLASGKIASPDVAPGKEGSLVIDAPAGTNAQALAVTATDASGHEIWTWVWPLGDLTPTLPAAKRVESSELTSGDVTMKFEDDGRTIKSVTKGDQTIPLTGGPRLTLSAVGKESKAEGELESVLWAAGEDGWFRLSYTYRAKGEATHAGITFDLPADEVTGSRWLGNGPYRVWQNRLEGGTLGVWELAANDTITGWRDWIYPEFRGFFSGVRWMTLNLTDDRTLTIVPENPDLFVQRLTPSLPPENLLMETALNFPDGDLSLLHAIPAIGTKFNPAPALGPQSQPATLDGSYKGTVWLRFK